MNMHMGQRPKLPNHRDPCHAGVNMALIAQDWNPQDRTPSPISIILSGSIVISVKEELYCHKSSCKMQLLCPKAL